MTEQRPIRAPWTDTRMALNAAEILAAARSKNGKFRERKSWTITCACNKPAKRILRAFVGPEDLTGEMRTWLVTSERRQGGSDRVTVPALSASVPRAGEVAFTMLAECPRCRKGWLIFPGGPPPAMESVRRDGTDGYIVVRDGRPSSDDWVAGDPSTTVRLTGEWADGPGSLVRARYDTPTYGNVTD